MKFLQIGAHIGNDEAFNIIKDYDIELGILVEPLTQLISELKEAYKGIPNIIIENKAIAVDSSDSISFYIDTSNPVTELSSMKKQHLLEHNIKEEFIKEIKVETENLNSLLDRHNIIELDYLFVDTEGFDYDILMSLDISKYKIHNIIFEDIHMDGTGVRGIKYKTLVDRMISEGYEIEKYSNNNTRCVLKNNIHIIYRTSDSGYKKIKPNYVNNANCLQNAIKNFPPNKFHWNIIADNTSPTTNQEIENLAPGVPVQYANIGHGAGTFNLALDYALTLDDDSIVYFLENDYIHRKGAYQALITAMNYLQPSFLSLYDHPDKYLDPAYGGNKYCEGGAEDTRIYLAGDVHWKITNSTTMTFAATVKTLKRVENILRKWTNTSHPHDFEMFIELREQNETLITPIPGYSTHGETQWLSPTIDWNKTIN
jgi:FkbM family methyltransferase